MQIIRAAVFFCCLAALSACATQTKPTAGGAAPHYKIGAPYQVNGRTYTPRADPTYDVVGIASWYGAQFHGKPTANGERFDRSLLSAAHTTLPLPSLVEVRNLDNGRRVIVRVNDRGPFVGDRLIDLSEAAARELGFREQGLARVRVRYIGPADLRQAAASPRNMHAPAQSRKVADKASVENHVGNSDHLAQLIERHSGNDERDRFENWVELAVSNSDGAIDPAPAFEANLAPVVIISTHEAGVASSSLRIGPFMSEQEAEAALAVSRNSGYPSARVLTIGRPY